MAARDVLSEIEKYPSFDDYLASLSPLRRARFERSVEDLTLVHEYKAGDQAAFAALYNQYKWAVYRIAKRILRDSTRPTDEVIEDCKDVVNATFTKVSKGLATFNEQSAFFTWVYRIAYNTALDAYRAKRRQKNREVRQGEREARDTQAATDKALRRREVVSALLKVIERLPKKHRDIMYLRVGKEMKYKDIADELGIPIGTVMSRLYYARKYIRRIYAQQRGEPVEPISAKPKQPAPMATRPKRGRPPKQPVSRRGGARSR